MNSDHNLDKAKFRNPPWRRFIRDTSITVDQVYHALMKGMTEEAVLEKFPGLEPDDLDVDSLKADILAEIQSRNADEITGRPLLPRERLVDGRYYKGRCRNATIARWNATEGCFYHWREKFGQIYIQTIKYSTDETEPWWDVFDAAEELPQSKFEIPFDESAKFEGKKEDLYEFAKEMWGRWNP